MSNIPAFVDVDINYVTSALNSLITALNTSQLATLAASGAVPVAGNTFVITKAGVAALTLAAPVVGTQDGLKMTITSNTAFAHTLTATGLFQTGTATVNLATFAAFAGATIDLMAYQGKWNVFNTNAITLT
jgi:hypothetical protein